MIDIVAIYMINSCDEEKSYIGYTTQKNKHAVLKKFNTDDNNVCSVCHKKNEYYAQTLKEIVI